MSRTDLELVRDWANAKLASYQSPLGARQLYTKVRNPVDAVLAEMSSTIRPPKVCKEQHEVQTEQLYATVGKIAILGEHLNFAISGCCSQVLEVKGLPQHYARIVLIGQKLEIMRGSWESLLKAYYAGDSDDIDMIDHVSKRLNNVIIRWSDVLHRLWLIGWRDKEIESYDVSNRIKDVGSSIKDILESCEEIIGEMSTLTSLVNRFRSCLVLAILQPGFGRPVDHFHYENGVLLEGVTPKSVT